MFRKMKGFVTLLAVLMLLSACGQKNEGNNGAEAASEPEGKPTGTLNFYTSQPDEDVAQLVEGFNEKYPDVTIEVFRSGTEEILSKVQAEKQSGNIQADVLLVADSVTFESLKDQDLLLSYKSEEANEIPETFVDKDSMYTGTKILATALVVNTEKVKKLPDSWNVLTGKEAKGNALMPSPLYSGAAAYNLGVFTRTEDFSWEFYNNLKANGTTVTQGNGAVLKEVAAGQKAYGMIVDFMVARAKVEGSPVELVYPTEGVPVITEPIGIMKDSENSEVAKVFVDYVLSEEGQKLASQLGYTPIRKGIEAPEGLKELKEINVLEADMKELLQSREEDKQRFSEIFGE